MHALFLCLLLIFDSILSSLHPSYIFLPQAANKCLVRLESTTFGLGLVSQAGCLLGTASLCHALSELETSGCAYGGPFVSFSFLPQGHHGGGQKKTPAKTGVSWRSLRRPRSAAGDGPCHHHPCPCVPLSRNENNSTAHLQLPECLSHSYLIRP